LEAVSCRAGIGLLGVMLGGRRTQQLTSIGRDACEGAQEDAQGLCMQGLEDVGRGLGGEGR
jgi:hypothetical protein